ncbi:NrsF family protein [Mesorhizobium sp. WSM2239]|uniref:NrsF family protein n=2 Tax=unclassified Mesorhizobium TaxID=325217 RepID=A0AAU8DEX3_9HYPH
MDTHDLIKALAADTRRPAASLSSVWWGAAVLAVAFAAVVFFVTLGPRPDIAAAAETPRFLFKFVATVTLAASAFGLARALSRPGKSWRRAIPFLATAPVLVAIAVIVELIALPRDAWSARMVGTNSLVCLTYIPLIGIGPLAIFLLALRQGAPTRPRLAGAVAGLVAGGIAATLYAAHCTDDSPLFVATWYTVAIAGLALVGAAAADRFVRW